jgi:hypothetical protein
MDFQLNTGDFTRFCERLTICGELNVKFSLTISMSSHSESVLRNQTEPEEDHSSERLVTVSRTLVFKRIEQRDEICIR